MPTDDQSTQTTQPSGPHGEPLRPMTAAQVAAAPMPYMRWAKAHLSWEALGPESICLGMSGLEPLAAQDRKHLGLLPPPDVGAAAANLKSALATRYDLTPEHVLLTAGTSHANFVAYLALARGGRIAVESPTYDAHPRLATAVSAHAASLRRDPRRGWRFDPASLAGVIDDRTDLIVVSDLHNPSGMRLAGEDLDLLVEAAERHDAYLLVDEVYADLDPVPRESAAHRSPRVLTTNSLTKAHGLPDLRCGWILGAPDVLARIAGWDDLVHPALPPAPMADAAAFEPQARERLATARARAALRSEQVNAWVETTPRVAWTQPTGGLTGFLLLEGLDGDEVAEHAWETHRVRIVPGSFFQTPQALRISFDVPEADLARALAAISDSLSTLATMAALA